MNKATRMLLDEMSRKSASLPRVNALLDAGADVNGHGVDGITALMTSAMAGRADLVHVLLKNGADPAMQCAGERETALIYAVAGGHLACVETLLATDAARHVNLADRYGNNALHACARGWPAAAFKEIVRALVAAGIDASHADGDGRTAADYISANTGYSKAQTSWLAAIVREHAGRYDAARVCDAVHAGKARPSGRFKPKNGGPR